MSGSTVGGVVGGVVGFFFGNPQLGWMLGSAIGGAIAPQTIKAPSIGDAQQQSSQAGVPRPVVYGHPAPFAGNIIDGEGKARKIKVRQRQGKGGPKVESERFLLTYAVRICEGPAKVLRIWRNGEIVYDRRAVTDLPAYNNASTGRISQMIARARARSLTFQQKVRIYEGTEDQLPDPALEALHGVGNTPYYRGTCYMVIEDDDVTDTRGAAAQYRFEVVSAGVEAPAYVELASAVRQENFNQGGAAGTVFDETRVAGNTRTLSQIAFDHQTLPGTGAPTRVIVTGGDDALIHDFGWIGDPALQSELATHLTAAGKADLIGPISSPPAPYVVRDLGDHALITVRAIYVSMASTPNGGGIVWIRQPNPAQMPASWTMSPNLPDALIGSDGLIYYPSWATSRPLDTLSGTDVLLASVVEDIAERCGVSASKLALAPLTDVIPGFLIAEQFTGADAIRPLQQAFFFDLPEVDGRIRAVKRGGAVAVTVTEDDLVDTTSPQDIVRAQAVEYPLKVSVVTQDPAAEYAAIPQTSGRASPDFPGSSEVVVQLPVPFGATESARIAHKMHKMLHSQAEGRVELDLPEAFSRYVPSDAFTYRDRRWLIEEVRYADGTCHWKAVYDRASSYESAVTGVTPRPPELPTIGLPGYTVLAAMNLPRLRTADNTPGMYVAVRGEDEDWPGCVLQLSIDGGESFDNVATITTPSVIAALTAAATADASTLEVEVRPGDELSSVTLAQLASRANGFALGEDTPEVGQFLTATEGLDDQYTLATVSRGQLGTTAAAHAVGAPFVLLDDSVLFLPLDFTLAGRLLIFRPVTFGTAEADSPTYRVVFRPQFTTLTIDPYTTESGDPYVDGNGDPYYRIS